MSGDDEHLSVSVSELSERQSPSQQIIELVGEDSGTPLIPDSETDPEQALPPLHSVVDTGALDSLVASAVDGPTAGRIEFFYHGCTVTICVGSQPPTLCVQCDEQPAESCSPSTDD